MMMKAVELAIEALASVEAEGKGERLALAEAIQKLGVREPNVIRLAHRLVVETLKRLGLVDELVSLALEEGEADLMSVRPRIRAFLRLLAYRAAIEKADVGELIELVRAGREVLGHKALRPFEEAIGRCTVLAPEDALSGKKGDDRLALELGVPRWLLEQLYRSLGRRLALAVLRASMERQPTYIRVNTLRAPEEEVLRSLELEGVKLRAVGGLRHVYEVLEAEKPLVLTSAYREGLFYIQDKASCLAVEVAGPEPGHAVLDVCAAPGAKTSHLAQLMDNKGLIISVDFSERRMKVWRTLTGRMGVKIALSVLSDARFELPVRLKADIVLLDPPCTSTGAFSRAPSARWRLRPKSARNMARIQARMLDACAEHVRPGGALIYATCSLLVEENELVVERFLRTHPDFELERAEPFLGSPGLRGLGACQRLYPHLHACDGYFIAKLRRAGP